METGRRVWNGTTRLMGNLIPALFCLPLLVAGILHFNPDRPFRGWPLYMGLFVVVGWFAVALFGFWNNDGLRQALGRKVDRRFPPDGETPPERWFVGVARPSYRNSLDPHEDVGFLMLGETRLHFLGDHLDLQLEFSLFDAVRPRWNMHTALGLGRWISLEGTNSEGTRMRFLIEPREKNFIPANWSVNSKLTTRLKELIERKVEVDSESG